MPDGAHADILPPDCSRPAGLLRRAIQITSAVGEVRAAVEDDYHHFRVAVTHDGETVTGVKSRGVRIPWTSCAFAGDDWSGFVGLPLPRRFSAISRLVEMKQYCTHMYELAGLAMAAAARGVGQRRYDAAVPYGGRRSEPAWVSRDGKLVFSWTTDGDKILGPDPFTGLDTRARFAAWVAENLTEDEGEAALVLRRAIFISSGRTTNLDARRTSHGGGNCYTTLPQRADIALRVVGSTQDFEHRPEVLLSADQTWLAFAKP